MAITVYEKERVKQKQLKMWNVGPTSFMDGPYAHKQSLIWIPEIP